MEVKGPHLDPWERLPCGWGVWTLRSWEPYLPAWTGSSGACWWELRKTAGIKTKEITTEHSSQCNVWPKRSPGFMHGILVGEYKKPLHAQHFSLIILIIFVSGSLQTIFSLPHSGRVAHHWGTRVPQNTGICVKEANHHRDSNPCPHRFTIFLYCWSTCDYSHLRGWDAWTN